MLTWRSRIPAAFATLLVCTSPGLAIAQTGWSPPESGVITTPASAIIIASAIVRAISPMPEAEFNSEAEWKRSFKAELRDGIWYVYSKPTPPLASNLPPPTGGGLTVELSQRDCRLLGLYRGQ